MNMEKNIIFKIIKEFILTEVEVNENSDFYYDLGLSSLDMINLIFKIEKELNVNIRLENLFGVRTVGEFINAINNV